MYEKLKKVSKSRNKLIAVVTVLFIGMVFANVLLTHTDKLTADVRVREEFNFTQTQNDQSTRPEIEDIEEVPFICTINGKKYLAEYITREDVEEMKKQSDLRDSSKNYNQIIDGHGTGLAPPTEEELDNLVGEIAIKEVISESTKSSDSIKTSSPSSIDLSSEIYFPPVGNQGSQGSCSSWANGYYAYGYMEARDNDWNAKSRNPGYLLSPAWIYNKLATYGSMGSWPVSNAKLMTDFGVATLNTMPYNAGDVDSWGDEAAWREAPYHRPLDYTLIEYDDSTTIDTIKSLLDSKIPVTFIIDHTQYYSGLSKATGDYILSSEESHCIDSSHANCFVGYDDSITEGSDVGAFRVVNSWGANWMDNGFYWLTYDAFKEFGGRGWQQLLFYTDGIDYEPSLIATWEFSSSPSRINNIITLGVGPYDVPLDTITPYHKGDPDRLFPTFMALDISEFYSYYDYDHTENLYLELGWSFTPGVISSFLVERYEDGVLQEIAPQSLDVPKTTPGHVNTQFRRVIPGPIYINDAGANNWAWAKTQGLCAGYGTQTHPYVIENLNINCAGSGSGIYIRNSNAVFWIRSNTISNSGSGSSDAGIKLYNTDNGYITNNDCSQNQNGIYLKYSNDNFMYGNTANDNDGYGIYLKTSNNNQIIWNTAYRIFGGAGIMLETSNDNYLWGNNVNNNYLGIYLATSNDNTLLKNSASDGSWGIYLDQSDKNEIRYNILNNNIYSGIMAVGCDYNGISWNTMRDNMYGISMFGGSTTNTIISNHISMNGWGIWVQDSDNPIILQNTVTDCATGIGLVDCDYSYVWWNTLIRCQYPIYVDGGYGISIKDNTIIP